MKPTAYTSTPLAPVNVDDPVLSRRITIDKSDSKSTVVWNPWSALAAKLPDMSPACWLTMVCIETANVVNRLHPSRQR